MIRRLWSRLLPKSGDVVEDDLEKASPAWRALRNSHYHRASRSLNVLQRRNQSHPSERSVEKKLVLFEEYEGKEKIINDVSALATSNQNANSVNTRQEMPMLSSERRDISSTQRNQVYVLREKRIRRRAVLVSDASGRRLFEEVTEGDRDQSVRVAERLQMRYVNNQSGGNRRERSQLRQSAGGEERSILNGGMNPRFD